MVPSPVEGREAAVVAEAVAAEAAGLAPVVLAAAADVHLAWAADPEQDISTHSRSARRP